MSPCGIAWVKAGTNTVNGFTIVLDAAGGLNKTAIIHWFAMRPVLAAEKLALFG